MFRAELERTHITRLTGFTATSPLSGHVNRKLILTRKVFGPRALSDLKV